MFRLGDTKLALGELTFSSMSCGDRFQPVLVDAALGVSRNVPGLTSQLLGKILTQLVCRSAPSYLWASNVTHLNAKTRKRAFATEVNSVRLLKDIANLTRTDKYRYFDTISQICPQFKAAPGLVTKRDLQPLFSSLRSAAQEVGALPSYAKPGFGGISFPFEVKVTEEAGRAVFPLQRVPNGTAVWKATEHNVAHFRSRLQLENHLLLLSDEFACDTLHFMYTWMDGCVFSCNGKCCNSHATNTSEPRVALALDEGSFVNHAFPGQSPSSSSVDGMSTFALRDIHPGTVLLEDYGLFTYDVPWVDEMFQDFRHEQQQRRVRGDTRGHIPVRDLIMGTRERK